MAPSGNLIDVTAGWPGLTVGYLRGVAPGLNVGGRLGFVYSVQGQLRSIAPGLLVQAALRFRFFDRDRLSLAVVFEPGFFFHSPYPGGSVDGVTLPVELRLGIAASSALAVAVLLGAPFWVQFAPYGEANVPILTGVGVEYFVTSTLALFARVRLGPTIHGTGRQPDLALDASAGVGFSF